MKRRTLLGRGVRRGPPCLPQQAVIRKGAAADAQSAEAADRAFACPVDGPYGGVPPFDKIKVADFKPALLKGMDLQRAEIAAIADEQGRGDVREHDRRARGLGPPVRPREHDLRHLHVDDERQGDAEASRRRWRRCWPRSPTRSSRTRRCSRASRRSTTRRANAKLDARAAAPASRSHYTNFARRGAALGARREGAARGDQPQLATLYTTFAQNQLADEESRRRRSTSEADLAGLPDVAARRDEGRRRGARSSRASGSITNTRSCAEPFLTYSSPPRPAREGVADVDQPRRQRRRARQQAGDHRDPRAARRAREAARLPDPRALDHRRQHGQDAGRARWR